MSKPVILTGLRANNDLQIGNYFGAMLPIAQMARDNSDEFQVNIFMPDLHSFTTPIDHESFQARIMSALKVFVAAGFPLVNPDVHIYRQSYVPAHTELAWILACFTGFGELSRMTEFKDKASRLGAEHIGTGQFMYPDLMAADILLYDAKYIPVGEDQRQHIEFTRAIGERINSKFGELFTLPETMAKQSEFFGQNKALRLMDLADPTKKMSKSDETGKGVIFLSDTPEAAKKKVMIATTDSEGLVVYDKQARPGLSNLIDILALLDGLSPQDVARRFEGQTVYGPLKEELANKVAEFLTDFQAKLAKVDEVTLFAKLQASEAAMNIQANETLLRVQKAVGLR